MWHYTHSGLTITSELHLPEWSQCEQVLAHAAPEVVIRLEYSNRAGSLDAMPPASIAVRDSVIRVSGTGLLHIRDGREIQVELLPLADPANIRPWLVGSAWGVLCYQRDFFMVHASAVQLGDAAILLCGVAGQGKSTLAAQLADRGCAIIGDDLCRLELSSQNQAMIYPSAPQMKLWSDTIRELGWSQTGLIPDHLREGKFRMSLKGGALPLVVPISAAYSLGWGEFSIRPLHGLAALRSFLGAATWQWHLLESMGQIDLHSSRCLDFLRRVPLAELTRPRDFSKSGRTLDFLIGAS